MNENEAALLFQALSNPDRLNVIRALVTAGPTGFSAGEIAEQIGASPSRASFHLSALSEVGLIHSERQSRSLRYSIDFRRIGALMTFLLEDCCNGDPNLRACCP